MEPILHALIPSLTLLALFPKLDRKLVLKLLPLTILPDLDFFIGHRYLFHNIFFVLIVSAAVYFIFRKNKVAFLIALLFLSSHLILDMSDPGNGLLYPFYDRLIRIDLSMSTSPADGRLVFLFDVLTKPLSEAVKDQRAPIFTINGILLLLLIIPLVILELRNRIDIQVKVLPKSEQP
jgi:membrane-bound metal-dependent hydrolase YbcI (DUF457 family)